MYPNGEERGRGFCMCQGASTAPQSHSPVGYTDFSKKEDHAQLPPIPIFSAKQF